MVPWGNAIVFVAKSKSRGLLDATVPDGKLNLHRCNFEMHSHKEAQTKKISIQRRAKAQWKQLKESDHRETPAMTKSKSIVRSSIPSISSTESVMWNCYTKKATTGQSKQPRKKTKQQFSQSVLKQIDCFFLALERRKSLDVIDDQLATTTRCAETWSKQEDIKFHMHKLMGEPDMTKFEDTNATTKQVANKKKEISEKWNPAKTDTITERDKALQSCKIPQECYLTSKATSTST